MARALTVAEQGELAASVCRPAFLFEGVFDSVTLRLWTGMRSITYLGATFLGNGWISSVKPVPEIDEIRAAGISIDLSFLSPTVASALLNHGKAAGTGKLWLVMLDSNWAVVGDGYLIFRGNLDGIDMNYSGSAAVVTVSYESTLATLLRPHENRYTDNNQRLFYPTDEGLQYVVQTQQWTGTWGNGENKLGLKRRDRR